MSSTGLRRLNRRRYRESVNALKQIISDPKTPPVRKLRSIEVLLSIYDRHDRTEQQKESRRELAAERAAQSTAEAPVQTGSTPDPEETTEEFLARLKRQEARLNEHEQEQETEEDDDE